MMFWAVFSTHCRAAVKPQYNAANQDALRGASVKVQETFEGFLYQANCIGVPSEVIADVDSQKLKETHCHLTPLDVKWHV